jgi:hypothetical protein
MQFPLEGIKKDINQPNFMTRFKIEMAEAVSFFNGCEKYFKYVKSILNEVRNEMISNNGNFEKFLTNEEFKNSSDFVKNNAKIPRIQEFVVYIGRLLPRLIEQHNNKGGSPVFMPAQLYHLTDSVLGACTRINNMRTIFENGVMQKLSWELRQYDYEVYHIKESIKVAFFEEEYSKMFINMLS